jgi:hypothetical protein
MHRHWIRFGNLRKLDASVGLPFKASTTTKYVASGVTGQHVYHFSGTKLSRPSIVFRFDGYHSVEHIILPNQP